METEIWPNLYVRPNAPESRADGGERKEFPSGRASYPRARGGFFSASAAMDRHDYVPTARPKQTHVAAGGAQAVKGKVAGNLKYDFRRLQAACARNCRKTSPRLFGARADG